MKQGMLVVFCMVLLVGCAGVEHYFDKDTGTSNVDSGSINSLNPSSSVLEVRRCEGPVIAPYTTSEEHDYGDGTKLVIEKHHPMTCETGWVDVAKVGGSQPGYLSFFSSAFQSTMQFLGLREIGKGLGDSGNNTTNNNDTSSNGGNSNSLSSARSDAYSNSNAAASAQGGTGGNGYGYGGKGGSGGSVINKGHRR